MNCKKCKKYKPNIKEIYFTEYIALLELINHSSNEKDKSFLISFISELSKKELCLCKLEDKELENIVDKIHKKEVTLENNEIKEIKSVLLNNNKLNVIDNYLDLNTLKELLKQEQEIFFKNKVTSETFYVNDLKMDMKIWQEEKNTKIIKSLKQTDLLILLDFELNEKKNYIDDLLYDIIKSRKIYDKTTYVLIGKENKNNTFQNIYKSYDATFYKWLEKNKYNKCDLKKVGKKVSLKDCNE